MKPREKPSRAGHSNADDILSVDSELVKSMDRNYQRERGIKSSGQTYYRFLAVNSLKPCVKACSLHIEDIFTSCFQVIPALRNKRRLADLPVRNNVCKFSIKFNDVDTVTAGDIARKCVGSSSVRIKSFEIDIGIDDSLIIIIVCKSPALA